MRCAKFPEVTPDLARIQGPMEAVLAFLVAILLFARSVRRFRLRVTKSANLPDGRGKAISRTKNNPDDVKEDNHACNFCTTSE